MTYERKTNRKPELTQKRINGIKKILDTYYITNALNDDEIMQGIKYIKELINYYKVIRI